MHDIIGIFLRLFECFKETLLVHESLVKTREFRELILELKNQGIFYILVLNFHLHKTVKIIFYFIVI